MVHIYKYIFVSSHVHCYSLCNRVFSRYISSTLQLLQSLYKYRCHLVIFGSITCNNLFLTNDDVMSPFLSWTFFLEEAPSPSSYTYFSAVVWREAQHHTTTCLIIYDQYHCNNERQITLGTTSVVWYEKCQMEVMIINR